MVSPDLRNHVTLVRQEYIHQTSRFPQAFWEPWVYLMAEAQFYKHSRRIAYLETLLETSKSVDGWGAEKLVEAMKGEQPPKAMPIGAFLASGEGEKKVEEEKPRRGLRAALRR